MSLTVDELRAGHEGRVERAHKALEALEGAAPAPARVEQLAVLLAAMDKYDERQPLYGDRVWRAVGWRGQLYEMRKKLDRIWHGGWKGEPKEVDNAVDLINYVAFFLRQVMAGERDGSWPWEVIDE